jgi:hypothetical protein
MKWLLPPAWAARYQRLSGAGFLLVILLLTVGRPVIEVWMSPVSFIFRTTVDAVAPYSLAGPWRF